MIVVDASAFIDAVDGRKAVIDRIVGEDIHIPHLLDIEVASALRRLVSQGRFTEQRATATLTLLRRGDVRRHPHEPLLDVIWALRGRVTAYDAAYVALATALDAPLVTTDRKLGTLHDLPCAVEVF
ncbi:MAG: type II toxin-antitoxin system VapC family toxin [bacterium]|nr:type II toxin-antitoxin system VapC family toxin [bacterium]MCP4966004.1 type II toxin-antitoxin system VapC family toxin [bacterium]